MPFHANILDFFGAGNNPVDAALRIGGGIGTWLSSNEQQRLNEEAGGLTEQQIADERYWAEQGLTQPMNYFSQGMDAAGGIYGALPGQIGDYRQGFLGNYQSGAGDILGGFDDRNAAFQQTSAGINRGYDDRYRFAQSQLDDYGTQQAEDIDRYYDEEQARSRMSLGSRGMLSSTEAATQGAAVTERRVDSQGRLQESLMQNREEILSRLSGDTLGYQQGSNQFLAALSGQGLNAQQGLFNAQNAWDYAMSGDMFGAQQNFGGFNERYGTGMAGLFGQGADRLINTIEMANYIPAVANQWPYQFGANSVQAPSSPDASSEQIAAWSVDAGRAAFSGGPG